MTGLPSTSCHEDGPGNRLLKWREGCEACWFPLHSEGEGAMALSMLGFVCCNPPPKTCEVRVAYHGDAGNSSKLETSQKDKYNVPTHRKKGFQIRPCK